MPYFYPSFISNKAHFIDIKLGTYVQAIISIITGQLFNKLRPSIVIENILSNF